jgi:2-dehydro-3-deoxy-D-gluconate 5-dehydrogenase
MSSWLSERFGLSGRTAVVTGARTGIGREISLALANCGADLILCGRTEAGLEKTAADATHYGAEVRTLAVDMSDLRIVRETAERLARDATIDILVNNAGIIRRDPLLSAGYQDWHEVVTVNLDSIFEFTRPFAAAMVTRGFGKIVNVASLLSFQGGLNVAAYAASKHGVVGLTQAMSNEWAPLGLNVNAVAPGYVETNNTAALRADPQRFREITARIPAGRWAKPADIAGAVAFLCAPAASYIHGHVLVVDGGWMAR